MSAVTPSPTPITGVGSEASSTLNTSDANNAAKAPHVLVVDPTTSLPATLAQDHSAPAVPVMHRGLVAGSGTPTIGTPTTASSGGVFGPGVTSFYAVTAISSGGGETLPSAASSSLTTHAALPNPGAAPTVGSPSGAGNTVPTGTYFYAYAAVDPNGKETVRSPITASGTAITLGQSVVVTLGAVSGASTYNVYRSTSSTFASGVTLAGSTASTSFTDTVAGSAQAAPTVNSTYTQNADTVVWSAGSLVAPSGQTIVGYVIYRGATGVITAMGAVQFVAGAGTTSWVDTGAVTPVQPPPTVDTTGYLGVADTADPASLAASGTNTAFSVPSHALGGAGTSWIDFDITLQANGAAATITVMPMFWNSRQSVWFPASSAAVIAPITASSNTVTRQTIRAFPQGRSCYLKLTSIAGSAAGVLVDGTVA